jgi:ECF sigma factor
VTNQDPQDITGMVAAWKAGETEALERLMDLLYPELRRIAHAITSNDGRPGDSLESAALASEAYLKW